jgi:UDP-N-acetylmuramoylalanine--D-glutamate ligase
MSRPSRTIRPLDLAGKRVLVLGLGVNQGGVGVARWLIEQGASVRVTDRQDEAALAASLAALDGLPINYVLRGHREEDIDWAELVVRNPAVPRESSWLAMARRRGVPVEMEMTLFFRACPAPIIGVTGTKGKTTTATVLATLLREQWPETILAGNMGRSAVAELARIRPDQPVVVELSSFQLEGLGEQGLSPEVAVVTNIAEDHLDRYASMEEYARVKGAIGRNQSNEDWLVMPRGQAWVDAALIDASARRLTFGLETTPEDDALWVERGWFVGRLAGEEIALAPTDTLPLPGLHSQRNGLAAIGAALVFGMDPAAIASALPKIEPVQDRLETVAVVDGVTWVNDTTATVPAAAVAALASFADQPLVVIAGGSEKQIDLRPLADALAEQAREVVLLDGAATPRLRALLEGRARLHGPFRSMAEAVEVAAGLAIPGAVVLLSPGCASFGMFRNEFHRGQAFREAVAALQIERGGQP